MPEPFENPMIRMLEHAVKLCNDAVQSDEQMSEVRHRLREAALDAEDPIDKAFAESAAEDIEEWRRMAEDERALYGDLFRRIARGRRLEKHELQELEEDSRATLSYRVGDKLQPIAKFSDSDDCRTSALQGCLSFLLLHLIHNKHAYPRVVQCKHCHQLLVVREAKRGRPRAEFCSLEHGRLYAKARWRKRQR